MRGAGQVPARRWAHPRDRSPRREETAQFLRGWGSCSPQTRAAKARCGSGGSPRLLAHTQRLGGARARTHAQVSVRPLPGCRRFRPEPPLLPATPRRPEPPPGDPPQFPGYPRGSAKTMGTPAPGDVAWDRARLSGRRLAEARSNAPTGRPAAAAGARGSHPAAGEGRGAERDDAGLRPPPWPLFPSQSRSPARPSRGQVAGTGSAPDGGARLGGRCLLDRVSFGRRRRFPAVSAEGSSVAAAAPVPAPIPR